MTVNDLVLILLLLTVLNLFSSCIYIFKFRTSKMRFAFYYIALIALSLLCFIGVYFQLANYCGDTQYFQDLIRDNIRYFCMAFLGLYFIPYTIISIALGGNKRCTFAGLPVTSGVLNIMGPGIIISPVLMLVHAFITKNTIGQYELIEANKAQENEEKGLCEQDTSINEYSDKNELNMKKHWSKKDFAKAGLPLHLVPLNKRSMKALKRGLDKESKAFIAEATYPFAIVALIKGIIYSIIVGFIMFMLNRGMGDLSGIIDMEELVYIIIGLLIVSFLLWRQSAIIIGYSEFSDSLVFTLAALVTFILTIEIKMIFLVMSLAFGGNGETADHLSKPRVGIPRGVGLDALIFEGMAADLYFKMSNIIDIQLAKNEISHYQRIYDENFSEIENIDNVYNYSSCEEQKRFDVKRVEHEKELKNAMYHLEKE